MVQAKGKGEKIPLSADNLKRQPIVVASSSDTYYNQIFYAGLWGALWILSTDILLQIKSEVYTDTKRISQP